MSVSNEEAALNPAVSNDMTEREIKGDQLFGNNPYRQFQAAILTAIESAGAEGMTMTRILETEMPGKDALVSKQIARSAIAELTDWSLVRIDHETGLVINVPDQSGDEQ
ncbi:hypothetical protein [Antrihabitans spumae]|uniref:Uncharacterized protein n=1 Tax=Antrihabitans spumae TaxID=3373370 RepID=A0ABW7KUK0_9NOCA